MKLARRMTVALVLGIFAVLALSSWSRVGREAGLFENDMRRDGHTMGRALSLAAGEVWRSDGQARAMRVIEEVNDQESQVQIRWVWLDAFPGDPSAPLLPQSQLLPIRSGREVVGKVLKLDGDEDIVTYAPVLIQGSPPGAIEVSESLAGQKEYLHATIVNIVSATATLALVCGVMTIGLGVWFVGRPMRSLIEQARRVGAGDLSGRIHLRQKDEIGELAAEMNAMCDRLVEANALASHEVSKRIETLQQLRHADRLATVGKLASGIAHELGTPLLVVSGRAQMIADGDVRGAEATASARTIHEQAARITAIIRQLLDFARRPATDKSRTDLREIARSTSLLLAPLADKKGVSIVVEEVAAAARAPEKRRAASSGFEASVDSEQLRQALTNLMVNGIQAMPRGGKLTLRVVHERAVPPVEMGASEVDYLRIDVQDEGDGITPEALEHLFEPFFTTKGAGEGTGLGLAVAQGIVREHGGFIAVVTRPGSGSRFSIYLPEDGVS